MAFAFLCTLQHLIYKQSFIQSRSLKLIQYTRKDVSDKIRVGYIDGDDMVVDIHDHLCKRCQATEGLSLLELLNIPAGVGYAKCLCSPLVKTSKIPLSKVSLKAPIHGMDKIFCVGFNYKGHCKGCKDKSTKDPIIFSKFPSTIIGPCDTVKLRSSVTKEVDYETELVVVIGRTASFVKASEAYDYVLGYTVGQDISSRDWQMRKNGGQFLLGKSMDTFAPIGPWIVTRDEIEDPHCLDIACCVNGEPTQKTNTKHMIHKIPTVIERLSSVMTLLPGDIIFTGTPAGTGVDQKPPRFLKSGDKVDAYVEKIGQLQTRFEEFC